MRMIIFIHDDDDAGDDDDDDQEQKAVRNVFQRLLHVFAPSGRGGWTSPWHGDETPGR